MVYVTVRTKMQIAAQGRLQENFLLDKGEKGLYEMEWNDSIPKQRIV
jgi:hypothetical protein